MGLPTITVPKYSLKLPSSGKEIKYRPFLVKEEKILLIAMESEDEKQIIDATTTVINNCIFGDIDVDTMPLFDIEYIFLWLRAKAKGEIIELKYTCPECENPIDISFNVEDVKLTKTENATNKIELTESLGIVLNYPNMTIQSKLDQFNDESDIEKIFPYLVSIDSDGMKSVNYLEMVPLLLHKINDLERKLDEIKNNK